MATKLMISRLSISMISTYMYLDDLLNTDNPYFEGMVNQIYPPDQQLNKANTTDTPLQMDLFLLNCLINAMTLILIYM